MAAHSACAIRGDAVTVRRALPARLPAGWRPGLARADGLGAAHSPAPRSPWPASPGLAGCGLAGPVPGTRASRAGMRRTAKC